jgi:T-complex protein 1 subunit theta
LLASGTIKHVKNAKIAVIACGLEMAKTETKGTVLLKSAQELLDFNGGEERAMEQVRCTMLVSYGEILIPIRPLCVSYVALLLQCIREIADSGVNVVISGGGVSDLALHYAERYNLMVLKEASKFNLRRLCQVTSCRPLTRLGTPTPEEIGSCDEVSIEEIGSTKICVFRRSADTGITTLVIRGSSQNILDDVERCIGMIVTHTVRCTFACVVVC